MKVYVRPRQGGKTHELIKLAAREHLRIVCAYREQALDVADRARVMGLDIREPLTWKEFCAGTWHGRRIKGSATRAPNAATQISPMLGVKHCPVCELVYQATPAFRRREERIRSPRRFTMREW